MTDLSDNEMRDAKPVQGAGDSLRQAREAKSMSTADVATQLHLDEKIIIALERDDKAGLPAPIFVRGYVKAYAKLLGLDEGPLLAHYQPADSTKLKTVGIPKDKTRHLHRAKIPWGLLGVLIVVLMVGAAAVFIVPSLLERFHPAPAPTDAGTENILPAPTGGSSGDGGANQVPLPDISSSTSGAADTAEPPATAPVEAEPATPAPQSEDTGAAVEAPPVAPAVTQPALEQRHLQLALKSESWVSIRDADGRRLAVGLLKAGEQRDITGKPPLKVVLGNAAAVQLTVDGKAYPLTQYEPGSVARFTIH